MWEQNRNFGIPLRHKQVSITKRYFIRRGHKAPKINWTTLYKTIQEFKLTFKMSYDLKRKSLSLNFVNNDYRWLNQMQFLQLYIKFLKKTKWWELPQKNLFFYLNKAKKKCYARLLKQFRS